MAKMNITDDLRAEFENCWEQSLAQFEAGLGKPVREIDLHFLRKMDAMLKQDYKRLYELEAEEHRKTRAEHEPPAWPRHVPVIQSTGPTVTTTFGSMSASVTGFGQQSGSFGATATSTKKQEPWEVGFFAGSRLSRSATGGAALCATATSPADSYSSMPPLEPPQLLIPPKRSLVEDCELHHTMAGGGAGLGYTHNGHSYSTFSPPCNGCSIGLREREQGIWHSGFYSVPSPIDASLVARKAEFQEPEPVSPIRRMRFTETGANTSEGGAATRERIALGDE